MTPQNHAVTFYDQDTDGVADIARFVADGLAQGERVVVVATAAHRTAVEEVLLQHGADAVQARVAGRYLAFDAAETLDRFMDHGMPDPDRFDAALGAVLDAAAVDGCAVRVFGEMVSLLWEVGNVAGALELEALWNGLGADRRFSLLCAYPVSLLDSGSLNDAHRVCGLHSAVQPPRSYAAAVPRGTPDGAQRRSDVFLPVASAVPAARRFLTGALTAWGEDGLVIDAAIIVSELATNAVVHAASPFRVEVRRAGDTVRISIEDVGPSRPELRAAAPGDFHGRGVAIVEHLARRWGYEASGDGKVVWAELGPR